MPEPEFFLVLFAAGGVFVVCCAIAIPLYFWGRKQNSKFLKILALLPMIIGLIVFMPMFILLLSWIWYWIFGDKTNTGGL